MTKEQEIVRSFLMSEFYWVNIDSEGGYETGGSCKRTFKGNVCPQAKLWDWSTDDEKMPKTFKNKEDCKDWFPESALSKVHKTYGIDTAGKNNRYQVLTKDLGDNATLILQIHQGSISGVGYDKGYSVTVGISYHNFIFKIYDYKESDGHYDLEALYDLDYLRSIDFSDMTEFNKNVDFYLSEYGAIRTCKMTSSKDMVEVLRLAMEKDTLTFSKEFPFLFKESHSNNDSFFFAEETIDELSPKKIIMNCEFDIEANFEVPESLESIEIKLAPHKYRRSGGDLERFLDTNRNLGKYINCTDDCSKIEAREIYNNELELAGQGVNLWFEYNELKGFVNTNQFQLGLLQEFYKKQRRVPIKIGEFEFKLTIKEFWDSIRIEKKIKYRSKMEKATEYFGSKVGYTMWFPESCDVRPKYEFEEEVA